MELFSNINKLLNVKIFSDDTQDENLKEVKEYKILVLGDKATGKTSLINRFCLNEFSLEIKPSVECECSVKTLKLFDEFIKLYIIDSVETILSSERYELYTDVKGVIILYDITKSTSFDKLEKWFLDVKQRINPQLPIILVGHKKDLTFLRNIDYEEGLEKAKKNHCEFSETSCIDDDSVDLVFKSIVAKIYFSELPETKKNYLRVALNKSEKEESSENKLSKITIKTQSN